MRSGGVRATGGHAATAALQRVREGRRDPVALAAPLAVGCAVVATARPRPRWAPVAAVSVLVVLRVAELRRAGFRRAGFRRAGFCRAGRAL
ncbi:hypothetical protein GCM10017691_36220 [Pseudonocardia petroleophila]|uniref:Uncharacterized protein n=1 Tax=Pseudonocardia petroleophila TaxID=37331 RepID=A0A7G7MCV4_9PSEU|nr:hypothetical protein [Pseudonocardia petroleophila]QNG50615.1 hypothetical protein H6H00_20605 [Pseudonocardia petroleophila]